MQGGASVTRAAWRRASMQCRDQDNGCTGPGNAGSCWHQGSKHCRWRRTSATNQVNPAYPALTTSSPGQPSASETLDSQPSRELRVSCQQLRPNLRATHTVLRTAPRLLSSPRTHVAEAAPAVATRARG